MELVVEYIPTTISARLSVDAAFSNSVWNRITQACGQADPLARIGERYAELAWGAALPVIIEAGTLRRQFGFNMRAVGDAEKRLRTYQEERQAVRQARDGALDTTLSAAHITERLKARGFTRRVLRDFQMEDVQRLTALRHGANFSVPGAGKTTVTLAVHTLLRTPAMHLLVVAPKNAFGAWDEVVEDCMDSAAPDGAAERLIRLDGDEARVAALLASGAQRFIISYDKLIRIPTLISRHLARYPVHLVLDESHRIKSGDESARGRTVLSLSALPIRRDILSGTPAPNSVADLEPQLDFLWPGLGLGRQVLDAPRPRDVLHGLYVRTTKDQLGLGSPVRRFQHVEMAPSQLVFYGALKSDVIRQLAEIKGGRAADFFTARRSVMRLLQASANPVAAAVSMWSNSTGRADSAVDPGGAILSAVIHDGDSPKMLAAVSLAREFAALRRKTVIWTIFRPTIDRLEALAIDLNPVVLHGGVPTGDDHDPETREGRIRRFHDDPACWVMIANPAACSEGISLHTVCHDAIYLDRSYNAAHYLQSMDRIHRLGLPPGTETRFTILQSVAPERVGSIDHSVSRRLLLKMQAMDAILDDPDIRRMALDEEDADAPVDRDITLEDFEDLLQQLLTGRIPEDEEAE